MDEDLFHAKFPDYRDFMTQFIHGHLDYMAPNEYQNHYAHIGIPFFTSNAPEGYSFNDIPETELQDTDTPFYKGLLYLYSKIQIFDPSDEYSGGRCSEYSYSIYLNRFIYYYHLHIQISNNELEGLENTAGVLIMTHGQYLGDTDDQFHSLEDIEGGRLQKMYICNKASVGCIAYGQHTDYTNQNGFLSKMYKSIESNFCVCFDDILEKKVNNRGNPDCRVKTNTLGTAMINRISPNTTRYINKEYIGNTDEFFGIIDLEKYHEAKKTFSGYSSNSINNSFNAANLIYDERLHKTSMSVDAHGKITSFTVELKDIINYYSKHTDKQTIFIYDSSCGVWQDIRRDVPNYDNIVTMYTDFYRKPRIIEGFEDTKEKLIARTRKLQERGLGKRRKRTRKVKSHNKRRSVRKTHKRKTKRNHRS